MIKHTESNLDIKIAKFMGWSVAHPFSTSDTYIGVVKRKIEKLGLTWSLKAENGKFSASISFVHLDTPTTVTVDSDTENSAICLALEEYINHLSKKPQNNEKPKQ